jgi:glycine cleavage system regulatory protein
LTELFRSQDITVEAIYNTRVCKSLTYVKDFCLAFNAHVLATQSTDPVQLKVKAVLDHLKMQLDRILLKWQNYVFKMIFDDKNEQS